MFAFSVVIVVVALHVASISSISGICNEYVRTEAGWVCGVQRWAEGGTKYVSYRGVPYAKQPLGEFRFKELQPVEPWEGIFDGTNDGPPCPQRDVFYGPLQSLSEYSEACIHANIHVPVIEPSRKRRNPPFYSGEQYESKEGGLPILVFIHGGGFAFGSGNTDLYGPEYLVSKGVIVITFNYRLNVFGFLSLNSASIPGNNGLRDMVTLLRWVQRNARSFGGDPADVTLAGQSAGAASAHLLSLSKTTEGLFKRVILMSGTGVNSFFTTSPASAQLLSGIFLSALGLNASNPEEAHTQLIQTPLETIMAVHGKMIEEFGVQVFMPVVESPFPGVTLIIDDDPEQLVLAGRGNDIPTIIGFTSAECESFRPRYIEIDLMEKIAQNPVLVVSQDLIYSTPPAILMDITKKVHKRYFSETPTLDEFVRCCSDTYFMYPAMKLAQMRASLNAAPTFLYQFSYEGDYRVLEVAFDTKFNGAAHVEDQTYVMRVNSFLGAHRSFPPKNEDDDMKDWMTTLFINFMRCSDPVCSDTTPSPWPTASPDKLMYQDLSVPRNYSYREPSAVQLDTYSFFQSLFSINSVENTTVNNLKIKVF